MPERVRVCTCAFDKSYILGKHGLIDFFTFAASLVAWICLFFVIGVPSVTTFLTVMSAISWIGMLVLILVIGFFFEL